MNDNGYAESVRTFRGILFGLAFVAPFWGGVAVWWLS